jgi:hypothetical protein
VEERARQEAEREQRAAELRRAHMQRAKNDRRWKVGLYLVATVIVVAIGFNWYSNRHVYHGPSSGTAECYDGTISYAAHHQGACSWHGGVYAWNR